MHRSHCAHGGPWIPSGNLTWLLKMTIYSGLSHEKWWFSIAMSMLNYQRVLLLWPTPVPRNWASGALPGKDTAKTALNLSPFDHLWQSKHVEKGPIWPFGIFQSRSFSWGSSKSLRTHEKRGTLSRQATRSKGGDSHLLAKTSKTAPLHRSLWRVGPGTRHKTHKKWWLLRSDQNLLKFLDQKVGQWSRN